MPTNDIQVYAGAGGANVITTSAYAALSARTAGFATGLARSNQLNKVWRQSSIMSSMLAQAISDTLGVDVVDDGTIAAIETHFYQMLFQQVMVNEYVLDTSGVVNTITVTPTPPVLSYFNGLTLRIKVANQNNGAMFINVSGLGVKSLVAPSGFSLASGGAVYAGQIITVTYDAPANVFRLLGGEVPYLGRHFAVLSSTTFVVPAGVVLLKVRMVGGGGGASGSTSLQPGAGGGGGEYREGVFVVTPGQSIVATIGAGGLGGAGVGIVTSSNIGDNGGSTSFGALMSASGGGGGGMVSGSSGGGGGGAGGSGGYLAIAGGSGGDGYISGASGPVYMPGYGGVSLLSTSVRAGTFSVAASGNANFFGGGGAGSYFCIVAGGNAVGGGAGSQGVIILEY